MRAGSVAVPWGGEMCGLVLPPPGLAVLGPP